MPNTEPKPTVVHVAVGVVENSQAQILIARRQGGHLAGYWEFPGGKVERGESVFEALRRELQEEVGITIASASPLMVIEHDYPDKTVKLDILCVKRFEGSASGREGQEVRWESLDKLRDYKFPEANAAIIEKLKSQ